MIPVYKPFLPEKSKKYALEAIKDGWFTTHKYNTAVEERLSDMLGVKHVLLANNGTTATHLVAKGLHFKHPSVRNLFVPNHCYVAAWNAFLYDKHFGLHVGKTHNNTWNCEHETIPETWEDSAAILVVHNLGNPVNVPKIRRECPYPIVEDACESFFGEYEGKPCGSEALISSFSFFGNKNITSGEGGAVVTNDDDIAEYLRSIRGQGQSNVRYVHDNLGYNYRMTNIQAAILMGQLDCVDEIKERKAKIWNNYNKAFKDIEGIKIQRTTENCTHSRWMYGIEIVGRTESFEDKQKQFNSRGIDIRPMFYPVGVHRHMNNNPNVRPFGSSNFDEISKSIIMLPSYPELSKEEQENVITTVIDFVNRKI